MQKHNKLLKKKWWVKWVGIPIFLLGFWFSLTLGYLSFFDTSFLVLSYPHSKEAFTKIDYTKLLKGEKIVGEFIAQEDNLGIVAIRFVTQQRIAYKDEDTLVFRLKEKGQKKWYYENEYKSGLTYDVPFLPFGFPKIADSKGKIYVFELESKAGNRRNAVMLSNREPIVVSKYQADKASLLANKVALFSFLGKKFLNGFKTIDVLFSSFVYFLPLLFYLLWINTFFDSTIRYIEGLIKNTRKRSTVQPFLTVLLTIKYFLLHHFDIILIAIVVIDILVLQLTNDVLYLAVISLWLWAAAMHKHTSKYAFIIGLSFISMCPFVLAFDLKGIAEKSAIWAYMFLVGGLLQALWEVKIQEGTHR